MRSYAGLLAGTDACLLLGYLSGNALGDSKSGLIIFAIVMAVGFLFYLRHYEKDGR